MMVSVVRNGSLMVEQAQGLQIINFSENKYTPVKKKYECANSAFKKEEEKKEAYFIYMGKILRQVHPDFSGCSWILAVLGSGEDWLLEQISLEAVRLSLYNHRRDVTSREILEAVKQRSFRKSF
ncbi:histone H2A.N [Erinaceus europaeus]|uniref:Histone H2A.N n=1 Tax=Erinaceus europaeus TaxID=9365 RepID=A0ABM3YIJ5_ERIEU|nr:histone H2A.N [Erinaceus europaeus]